MKTLKLFLLLVLESLKFGGQVIRYAPIFVSAFFRHLASPARIWMNCVAAGLALRAGTDPQVTALCMLTSGSLKDAHR